MGTFWGAGETLFLLTLCESHYSAGTGAEGDSWGPSCARPGAELTDPYGCLEAQMIL